MLVTLIMLSYRVLSQVTELPFFASRVHLGRNGVEEIYALGPLNEYERSDKRVVISPVIIPSFIPY